MSHLREVRRYYHAIESVLGYRFVVNGVKHFGYYPEGREELPFPEAHALMNDQVAKALGLPGGADVLEAGCGEGFAASHLATRFGYAVTGIDILPRNVARARRRAHRDGSRNTFLVGDFMRLPFPDATFDGAYGMEALIHAPDAGRLFRELARVLRPGGILVFCEYSTIPRNGMTGEEQTVVERIGSVGAMPMLHQFIHGTFPALLEGAGFQDVEVVDFSERVRPMLRVFHDRAKLPMKIITALGLENRFINTFGAYHVYRQSNVYRYNCVRAVRARPDQGHTVVPMGSLKST